MFMFNLWLLLWLRYSSANEEMKVLCQKKVCTWEQHKLHGDYFDYCILLLSHSKLCVKSHHGCQAILSFCVVIMDTPVNAWVMCWCFLMFQSPPRMVVVANLWYCYYGGRRLKSLGTPVLDDKFKFYPLKRHNVRAIIFNSSQERHQRGTLQCLSIVS